MALSNGVGLGPALASGGGGSSSASSIGSGGPAGVAATGPGGGGTRFHGFQTARAPARPSTAATATRTAVRERLAGWVGPGAVFIGWVGWATRGAGTSGAVGAPEKASASASANSPQLVKRWDGGLARAFATTASTPRGRAAFRVLGGGGASLTIL